jgi:hypothetical protein
MNYCASLILLVLATAVATDLRNCHDSPRLRRLHRSRFRRILGQGQRTSFGTAGRPTWPCRIFHVQKRRKPFRCHAMTVSGLTMTRADRQSLQIPHSQAYRIRGLPPAARTAAGHRPT